MALFGPRREFGINHCHKDDWDCTPKPDPKDLKIKRYEEALKKIISVEYGAPMGYIFQIAKEALNHK